MLQFRTMGSEVVNEYPLVEVDREKLADAVTCILQARDRGVFPLTEIPPERPFIELTRQYGEQTGDETYALHALFLASTCAFGFRTARLFRRLSDPELFENYSWVFQPQAVLDRIPVPTVFPPQSQRGSLYSASAFTYRDIFPYLQPEGYAEASLWEWAYNCQTIQTTYGGDLRNFFHRYGDSAVAVVKALEVRLCKKTHEVDDFRRFGPKLSRLAIQWIQQYELYHFNDAESFGLPVDFHLGRILTMTEILQYSERIQAHTLTYKVALKELSFICEQMGVPPQTVSELLWLIGSLRCTPQRHDGCPLSGMCNKRLLSRKPYDQDGMFDPHITVRDNGQNGG